MIYRGAVRAFVGSLALALAWGCGGASGGNGTGGNTSGNCPGNSSNPCVQLSNAFTCLADVNLNCTSTPLSVGACDQAISSCTAADDVQIDDLATCIAQIAGGDCSTNSDLIQQESLSMEDCFGKMTLSAACQSASGLAFVSSGTDQSNGTCPSVPDSLTGTAPPGASCTLATQCAPVCCTCANGSPSQFLAAACVNEACAADGSVCAEAENQLSSSELANTCP